MGQALYRKHRPKKLSEVIGQEHITATLESAIKSGRISHAYLFTGPRGVGKTSIARILAHEINSLPYTNDTSHIDIIEIDAASNRRIDEIRELREKVYIAPAAAKYKVYIIDEVHMLTREAFNALLKTLEEPPEHVIFILATTDAHKLPETIISRTQRFTFRPVESQKLIDHLKSIARQEKITISDDALTLLAEHGEGSFRDSISLLDQAAARGKKIELADIQELLGIPLLEAINNLTALLADGPAPTLLMQLQALYEQGFRAAGIAKKIAEHLRQQLADDNIALPLTTTLSLLERLIDIPASPDPERLLEIILLEVSPSAPTKTAPSAAAVSTPAQSASVKSSKPAKAAVDNAIEPAAMPKVETLLSSTDMFDLKRWPDVLAALKKKHNTVYSIVRMGQPSIADNGHLVLAFAFAFHQKRVNDNKNRQLLAETIHELTGQAVAIDCIFDKGLAATPLPLSSTAPASDGNLPALNTISNIFGGGELLES